MKRSNKIRHASFRPCIRKGAAAVECAIVLPVCVTLMLGCTDFARSLHAQIALANAARAGADYAATHRCHPDRFETWMTTVKQTVQEEAATIPAFSASHLTTEVMMESDDTGEYIVALTAEYNFETAVSWPGLPDQLTLRTHIAMRQYR